MTNPTPGSMVMVLPPAPHLCQVCAREHLPELPHDPTTLYYGTVAALAGEPATWARAMAHCAPEVREAWTEALEARGIDVNGPPRGTPAT